MQWSLRRIGRQETGMTLRENHNAAQRLLARFNPKAVAVQYDRMHV
jgi:hypothetical protein